MTTTVRIGLEVHVQLATRSKMFCRCPVRAGAPPNTLVCPVCLGLPGTLPVPNRAAFTAALVLAAAFGARVAPRTRFDRKHYFYPDLPKGYQITQHAVPLATGGALTAGPAEGARVVRLRRLHLEEDAGKSVHDDAHGATRIDFNRAGVPLVELVTEPDLRSPAETRAWLRALRELLGYLDVSEARPEAGQLRFEPNVNLEVERDGRTFATPVSELKNLNSLRHVERALQREIERQRALVEERGDEVAWLPRATLGWDERGDRLVLLRMKERAPDYRFLPDPDLPPVRIDDAWCAEAAARVPELPHRRRARLRRDFGLDAGAAERLCRTRATADRFEALVAAGAPSGAAARWTLGPLADLPIDSDPAPLARLVALVEEGRLARGAALREVLPRLSEGADDPGALVERLGLEPVRDEVLVERAAREAVAAHPGAARDFRAGRGAALEPLVGAVLRATRGRVDPRRTREVLRRVLREEA